MGIVFAKDGRLYFTRGEPCSSCGLVKTVAVPPDAKPGQMYYCDCGHLLLFDGLMVRDMTPAEAERYSQQANFREAREWMDKRLHELGMWG